MLRRFVAALTFALVLWPAAAMAAPSAAALQAMVKRVDDRLTNPGDLKWRAYMETREEGKAPQAIELVIYRRDRDDSLMVLALKPKTEAGKGYLRIDKNLFLYDPSVGRWERRTKRERLLGSDTRQEEIDETSFAADYTPEYVAAAKLGDLVAHHVRLTAKEGAEVAYQTVELWLDKKSGNLLKRQDKARSGRLLRTVYFRKWARYPSPSKKSEGVYIPGEVRIFDEVQKGRQTIFVSKNLDLSPLPEKIFTKAWLESKSR